MDNLACYVFFIFRISIQLWFSFLSCICGAWFCLILVVILAKIISDWIIIIFEQPSVSFAFIWCFMLRCKSFSSTSENEKMKGRRVRGEEEIWTKFKSNSVENCWRDNWQTPFRFLPIFAVHNIWYTVCFSHFRYLIVVNDHNNQQDSLGLFGNNFVSLFFLCVCKKRKFY